MTDIDMLTENSWDAEREEKAWAEADMTARELLLESVTVAQGLLNILGSHIRVDSVSQHGGNLRFLIPNDGAARAAIKAWGIGLPEPREYIATGTRDYSFFVTRSGIRRFATVTSIPYPEKAGVTL